MPPEESTSRIVDRPERNAATSFRDNAGGPPVEQVAVTGRPNDLVEGKVTNTTFRDRAKASSKTATNRKAVESGDVEDKSVARSERKSTRGRR